MQFGVFMSVNIRIIFFRDVTLPDYTASHPMLVNWVSAVDVKYLFWSYEFTCNLQANVPKKLVSLLTKLRLIFVGYGEVG